MIRLFLVIWIGLLVTGCYNPLNQVTANRYEQTCGEADASGHLEVAEEACRRAVINVRIGHLGGEAESQSLYNYARIKMQLGKHEEAEELYKESLKIEDAMTPPDQLKIGRRLTNLAIVMGNQYRFKDAWPYLTRLVPMSDQYSGQERHIVKTVFERFAEEYRKMDMKIEAAQLLEKAKSL